jgi:hypothetical protein
METWQNMGHFQWKIRAFLYTLLAEWRELYFEQELQRAVGLTVVIP